ncbi:GIY-YIG nuclease family protein [Streptomyces sp. VTCC 41912]|uniref:GIY-YIG nuclease family protein n=1 Tax=Streptomyces sp. VTCC 41912 TaxID=3383243 RepID=UPI0038968F9D
MKREGRTALYRVFDAAGKLLYIGISQNPDVRFGQHSQTKPWWPEVVDRKVEWHESRAEAAEAERAAIESEQPHWNLNHAVRPIGNPESDDLYAEHRWNLEEMRALLPALKEQAAQDLKAGATPAQLAKLTGLSDEYFRRIARAVGADRKRAPTVGREAKKQPDA